MLAKRLQSWDTIWIVNPSQPLGDKKYMLMNFIEKMKEYWLKVKLWENYDETALYGTAAWTPKQRADDINSMFLDSEVNAIWCGLWWETANWVLDLIDYDLIKQNPKLFLWKSDIDVLHCAIHTKTWLITFHCCDPEIWDNKEIDVPYSELSFKERLLNGSKVITNSKIDDWRIISSWKNTWKFVWCNIESMLKLAGTPYFPNFDWVILWLETYKSNPSILVSQLTHMKNLWIFNNINWIIIWNDCMFNSENVDAERIVSDFTSEYTFPVLKINEFWHHCPHAFLPIWAKIELDASNKTIKIVEDFIL